MTQGTLYESKTVTLNGSGNGTVKLGPISAREVWSPSSASVKTNQTTVTNEAVCNLYVGLSATQENFRDGTFSGSSGDSSDLVAGQLKIGNFVWAVWTGGDAGAQATLVVTGTKEV
jgi:hypothetical protein